MDIFYKAKRAPTSRTNEIQGRLSSLKSELKYESALDTLIRKEDELFLAMESVKCLIKTYKRNRRLVPESYIEELELYKKEYKEVMNQIKKHKSYTYKDYENDDSADDANSEYSDSDSEEDDDVTVELDSYIINPETGRPVLRNSKKGMNIIESYGLH